MTDALAYPAYEVGVTRLGHRHFLLHADDGDNDYYLWWHDCPDQGGWGWFGKRDTGKASGHGIESRDPLTVKGSLICNHCGDHGFIRDGKWVPA